MQSRIIQHKKKKTQTCTGKQSRDASVEISQIMGMAKTLKQSLQSCFRSKDPLKSKDGNLRPKEIEDTKHRELRTEKHMHKCKNSLSSSDSELRESVDTAIASPSNGSVF